MLKGDKDWMAKGISCNGSFVSPEKKAEKEKILIKKELQKLVDDTKENLNRVMLPHDLFCRM